MLTDISAKIVRKEFLGVVEESSISFSNFVNEWWAGLRKDLKPRTLERWRGIVDKHLKPHFRGALRAITAAAAEAYINSRLAAGVQPGTVNREMTVLKLMMSWAVSRSYLSRNPFRDAQGKLANTLRPLKEPSGIVRFLTPEEIDRLLEAAAPRPWLHAFIMVAINTGMRRNEILSLSRKSIDWQNRIATLTDTKNGDIGHVDLNDGAFDALASLPTRLDGFLFPFGPNQVSVEFKRLCRRAGIDDFRLHDMRHTFASYQAMDGRQGRALQSLLRHKRLS